MLQVLFVFLTAIARAGRDIHELAHFGYNYPLVRNSTGGQGQGVGNRSGKCEPNLLDASELFTNI